ncbi:hypothetical protein BDW71DRAFT_186195 [Aspergillus fruticulosus]
MLEIGLVWLVVEALAQPPLRPGWRSFSLAGSHLKESDRGVSVRKTRGKDMSKQEQVRSNLVLVRRFTARLKNKSLCTEHTE